MDFGVKEKYEDDEGHQVVVYEHGSKEWLKNGELHRDGDKPAIVYEDGTKYWYKNGKIHRENNASIVYSDSLYDFFFSRKYIVKQNLYHLRDKEMIQREYWVRLLLLEY